MLPPFSIADGPGGAGGFVVQRRAAGVQGLRYPR